MSPACGIPGVFVPEKVVLDVDDEVPDDSLVEDDVDPLPLMSDDALVSVLVELVEGPGYPE